MAPAPAQSNAFALVAITPLNGPARGAASSAKGSNAGATTAEIPSAASRAALSAASLLARKRAAVLVKRVSPRRRYLREGRLTGRRFGGQWFIDQAELDAFHEHLQATTGFLESIPPATKQDPLVDVIGIGNGGGANIAQGKNAYRRAFWWRR